MRRLLLALLLAALASPSLAQVCTGSPPTRLEKGPYRERGHELTSEEFDAWLGQVRALCTTQAVGRWGPAVADSAALAALSPGDPGECHQLLDTGARCCWSTDLADWQCGAAFDIADIDIAACGAGNAFTAVVDGVATCSPFAASSHVHAASDTTSGTFADARIAASSVTQHETALEGVLDLQDMQGAVTAAQIPAATTAARGGVVLSTSGESTAGEAVEATDARLSDARTPTAHASTHAAAGGDAVTLTPAQVVGVTTAKCARFDGGGVLVAASADCASGDTDTDARVGVVKEADGSPSVSNVSTIQLSGCTVTDNGSGDVTITCTGALPAGSGSELQFRSSGTAFGAVTSSSVSGADITLGGTLSGMTQLTTDNLRLDGNTLSSTNVNGNIALAPNGTGQVTIPDGSVTAPGIAFASDLDTGGPIRAGANDQYWISDGSATWSLIQLTASGGAAAGVTRFYNSDSSGRIEIGSGGNQPVIAFNTSGYSSGYGFVGDSDTVFRRAGADNACIQAGGVDAVCATATTVTTTGVLINTPQAATCADSGNASPSTLTLTPTSTRVHITNSDADGCTVTMGETGMVSGAIVQIIVVSSAGGTVDFADTSGVSELAGAFNAGLYDSLTLSYISDRWVQLARSDN